MALEQTSASRWNKLFLTLLLTVLAIPVVLPLVWLVLSSLKSQEHVLTDEPEWLPWVETYTVHDAALQRDVKVTVLDRSRAATLGTWRIRPAYEEKLSLFYWPADQVQTTEVTGYVAPIGAVKRTVTAPQPTDTPGTVRVGQLGTQRVVRVEPGSLRETTTTVMTRSLAGQDVRVETEETPLPDRPDAVRLATLKVVAPSAVFPIATERLRGTPDAPRLAVDELGIDLPVHVDQTHAEAGVSYVQFTAGEPYKVDQVVAPTLKQVLAVYTMQTPAGEVQVKPTRRDANGQPTEVAVLGELKTWDVPEGDVTAVTHAQQQITFLGQPLSVRVRDDADPRPGEVAVQPTGAQPYVTVAADRVTYDKRIVPQWINYLKVFSVEPLHKYVLNTLFITGLCILGNVLSCGIVGYAFARMQFRGKNALFLILLSTMMLPSTITFLPTYIIYVKIGWLDTFYPLIVPTWLATSAFFVFLYRQFFLTVPLDLEDAARIDGCGPLKTFWYIMLPMAKPAVVTVTVFTFMGAWNDFMGPLLYLNTNEYQTLAYALYSFKSSFGYKFPHYMMAASTMMMIPTLIIFFLAQNAFMRGVVVTGVKG